MRDVTRCLFDSSAIAKRYHQEAGSARVDSIFLGSGSEIGVSRLTYVEVRSVFAVKVRSGTITQAVAIHLWARFEGDLATGAIQVFGVEPKHFFAAEKLIEKHGFSSRLRTLDAIQLAVALDLSGQGLIDQFVVADKALAEVAAHEGLSVLDPAIQ